MNARVASIYHSTGRPWTRFWVGGHASGGLQHSRTRCHMSSVAEQSRAECWFCRVLGGSTKGRQPTQGPRVSKLEGKTNQEETVNQIEREGLSRAQAAGNRGDFPGQAWAQRVLACLPEHLPWPPLGRAAPGWGRNRMDCQEEIYSLVLRQDQ